MQSLRKVMHLAGETKLLAGHGPASTLDMERQLNPFVIEALG